MPMSKHTRSPTIVSDPEIMGGRPCLSGTRIPVDLVLEYLADGWTSGDLKDEYPELKDDDVRAVLRYAADRVLAAGAPAE